MLVPLVFRRPEGGDLRLQRQQRVLHLAHVGRVVHVLAGRQRGDLDGLQRVVAHADLAGIFRIPQRHHGVRPLLDLLGVVGEGGQAPDPGDGIVLAVLHEAVAVPQRRRQIGEIGDLRSVDRLDQPLVGRVHDIDVVDQHHVIGAGAGAQLGQHLLFGVEVVMHHLDACLLLEHLERPFLVGAVALPVEHLDLAGGAGALAGKAEGRRAAHGGQGGPAADCEA